MALYTEPERNATGYKRFQSFELVSFQLGSLLRSFNDMASFITESRTEGAVPVLQLTLTSHSPQNQLTVSQISSQLVTLHNSISLSTPQHCHLHYHLLHQRVLLHRVNLRSQRRLLLIVISKFSGFLVLICIHYHPLLNGVFFSFALGLRWFLPLCFDFAVPNIPRCEEFSTKYKLRKHYKCSHQGHDHKCQDCENKFRTEELLHQHKTKEHGEEKRTKRIICAHCKNKTFTYFFGLENHYNTVHRRLLFKCLKCDNSFFTESLLKEHAGIHKDPAKDPFIVSHGGSA